MLAGRDRRAAPMGAPPHCLFLHEVLYPADLLRWEPGEEEEARVRRREEAEEEEEAGEPGGAHGGGAAAEAAAEAAAVKAEA